MSGTAPHFVFGNYSHKSEHPCPDCKGQTATEGQWWFCRCCDFHSVMVNPPHTPENERTRTIL